MQTFYTDGTKAMVGQTGRVLVRIKAVAKARPVSIIFFTAMTMEKRSLKDDLDETVK